MNYENNSIKDDPDDLVLQIKPIIRPKSENLKVLFFIPGSGILSAPQNHENTKIH
jgi:hypothetical protein